MTTWNKSPQEQPKKLTEATFKQAELLRYQSQLADEVSASPLSRLSKEFYTHWARPFVSQEPEIPP